MPIIETNREFILLTENTFCSPNGDPDNDNRPRMNFKKDTALSSDVRIKRDVRNWLSANEFKVFVDRVENENVTANQMVLQALENLEEKPELLDKLLPDDLKEKIERPMDFLKNLREQMREEMEKKQQKGKSKSTEKSEENLQEDSKKEKKGSKNKSVDPALAKEFLQKVMVRYFKDVTLFGATLTVVGFNEAITGPIQINWGESLNKVQLVDSVSITTRFASKEEKSAGSMGKKYQVYYALIPFYGTISKTNARDAYLFEDDVRLFRKSLVQGMLLPTGSKLGRMPIFYLEIEYKPDFNGLLGNLSRFIGLVPDNIKIRSFREIEYLDFTKLADALETIKEHVENIYIWNHPVIAKYYSIKLKQDQSELGKLACFRKELETGLGFKTTKLDLFAAEKVS